MSLTLKRKRCFDDDPDTEFASEFNNPETSDRILRFEIIDEIQAPEKLRNELLEKLPNEIEPPLNIEPNVEVQQKHSKGYGLRKSSRQTAQLNLAGISDLKSPQVDMECIDLSSDADDDKTSKEDNKNSSQSLDVQSVVNEKPSALKRKWIFKEEQDLLHVHSIVLAVKSPYFKSLFYSGMKESSSKEVVMKVHANEMRAHVLLIKAMYNPSVLNTAVESYLLAQVLVLSDKYNVSKIFHKCQSVLLSSTLTVDTWQRIIFHQLQHMSNVNELHRHFEMLLTKEFKPLEKTWRTLQFRQLTEHSIMLLLDSKKLQVECENTVFVALMRWVKRNVLPENLPHSDLLCVVRFEFLSVDFLHDVVQFHELATKMAMFDQLFKKGMAYHAFSKSRREHADVQLILKQRPTLKAQVRGAVFTWLINELNTNVLLESGFLASKVFYCRGYRMKLQLSLDKELGQTYSLCLCVLDMRPGSLLRLSWYITSRLLVNDAETLCTTFYSSNSNCGSLPSLISKTKLQLVASGGFSKIDLFIKF